MAAHIPDEIGYKLGKYSHTTQERKELEKNNHSKILAEFDKNKIRTLMAKSSPNDIEATIDFIESSLDSAYAEGKKDALKN